MYYIEYEDIMARIPLIFTRRELESIGWGSYTQEDIEAILGRSEGFIDSLRYKGSFVEEYQEHAFPRKLGERVIEKSDERIANAICCVLFDYLKSSSLGTSRSDLIRQGVKSISTAGVSESYGTISDLVENEVSRNYVKYLSFCLFDKFI